MATRKKTSVKTLKTKKSGTAAKKAQIRKNLTYTEKIEKDQKKQMKGVRELLANKGGVYTSKIPVKAVIKQNKAKAPKVITKEDRIKAITYKSKINAFHKTHLVPLVVEKLQRATSKSRIISASEIRNSIWKNHGVKINSGLLRSILHHIRINGIVKCLLASGQGYFITNDTLEMQVYLKSLDRRIRQIGALRKALDAQGHESLQKQTKATLIKKSPLKSKK